MPSLVVVEGAEAGKSYPLARALVLGRQKGVDVLVEDIAASREHCKVFAQDGDWFVIDLGSRNGTKVNGAKISRLLLNHGDAIVIGKTVIRFDAPELPPRAPVPAAAKAPAAAPRGPSALDRERERLRQESVRDRGARRAKDDGTGVVIREKVLQYGRIDDRGSLLKEDLAQRGGLFKAALAVGLLAAGALVVWGIVKALERDPVEDPDAPEGTTGR